MPLLTAVSGYAHFDGTSWSGIPTSRIELGIRTGYPALTNFGDTETVVAHNSATGHTVQLLAKRLKTVLRGASFSTSTTTGSAILVA